MDPTDATQGAGARIRMGWKQSFGLRSAVLCVALGFGSVTVHGQQAAAPSDPAQVASQSDQQKPSKATLKADKEASKADKKKDNNRPIAPGAIHDPILWQDPGDIASKDMLHGQGGEDHQPKAPFTFESEDHAGTNPKFDARDADGKKWRVKLGVEARPEVVTSRLLWAMGYFVEDDYVLPTATVSGLHLDRGQNLVGPNGAITDARFARKAGGQDKIAVWRWKENPFTGKREFNGLRVMMALTNNWDLKDVNNAVYSDSKNGDRQLFLCSDIGATFGSNGEHNIHRVDKGNAHSYEKSIFIAGKTRDTVSFGTPHPPYGWLMHTFLLSEYFRRVPLDAIGKDIPREDARWMGEQLGKLSHQQLVDAFKAGNFSDADTEIFVRVLEHRIAELKAL